MRRALLLIFLGVPLAGGAQVPTIIPGARVRVESRQIDKNLEGTVMSQTADSVIVASVGAIRTAVASGSITRIRVSQGKSHGAGAIKGIKIGGGIGLGLGVLLGLAIAAGPSTSEYPNPGGVAAVVAALYAVSGAMWGAAIGGAVGAEKWTTVYSIPMRISVGRPQRRAPGVSLSITF
jgi:hypothetical protein